MGYYNWGEQISNSFMSMLNMNQQRRLENAKLDLEKKSLEDTMKTNALNRQNMQMEIDARNKETSFWDSMPGVSMDFDGDKNTPATMVPAIYAQRVMPMSYSAYSKPIFDNGKMTTEEGYAPVMNQPSLIDVASSVAKSNADIYNADRSNEAQLASARISSAASINAGTRANLVAASDEIDKIVSVNKYMSDIDVNNTAIILSRKYGVPYENVVFELKAKTTNVPGMKTINISNPGTFGAQVPQSIINSANQWMANNGNSPLAQQIRSTPTRR